MSNEKEMIAKALEIAIGLTPDVDHPWFITDGSGNVMVNQQLLQTTEAILRVFNGKNLIKIVNDSSIVYPDI
jgi:hypothetical protein